MADRIGEYSLTDKRHSRITKFMAETLFDENIGGPYGNSHIALGMSYRDTYAGDVSKLTTKQAEALGFNDSSVHTDIILDNTPHRDGASEGRFEESDLQRRHVRALRCSSPLHLDLRCCKWSRRSRVSTSKCFY